MESVGESLRRIREKRHLSIEDLARKTRVRPEFLEALEEDRFEIFPAHTYIVGFLRAYARAVGIDEEEVLRCYRSDRGASQPEEDRLWGDDPDEEEERNRFLPLAALLLLVIAVVAVFLLRR